MALTRKRHRLLIAAAVVVLVGGLWFIMVRHRIDQRLVGRWTLQEGTQLWVLRSDGSGDLSFPGQGDHSPDPLRWWVRGEHLFLDRWTQEPQLSTAFLMRLLFPPDPVRFRVRDIQRGAFVVEFPDGTVRGWRRMEASQSSAE
jgi:hypothetical protein